jgi:hypothetical protein
MTPTISSCPNGLLGDAAFGRLLASIEDKHLTLE